MYTASGNSFDRTRTGCISYFLIRRALIALALLAVQNGYGQPLSPLQTQLQNAPQDAPQDTTRLRLSVQLADTLFQTEQLDSLYAVTQRAIPLAVALKATQQEGKLYYLLSRVYRYQRASNKTLETLRKAIQLSRRAHDVETQAKAMYIIPNVYSDMMDYKKVIDASLINLDFFKKHGFTELESDTYAVLASLYQDLGDKQQYAFYIHKSLQHVEQIKNPSNKILTYINAAEFHENEGNIEKAWTYIQKALAGIHSPTVKKSGKFRF